MVSSMRIVNVFMYCLSLLLDSDIIAIAQKLNETVVPQNLQLLSDFGPDMIVFGVFIFSFCFELIDIRHCEDV